eukprot:Pgem_evm1s4206
MFATAFEDIITLVKDNYLKEFLQLEKVQYILEERKQRNELKENFNLDSSTGSSCNDANIQNNKYNGFITGASATTEQQQKDSVSVSAEYLLETSSCSLNV